MYYTVEVVALLNNGNTKLSTRSFMTTSRRQIATTQQTVTTEETQTQTDDSFSVDVVDIGKERATLIIVSSYKVPFYEVALYKENIRLQNSPSVRRTDAVTYTTIQPLKPGILSTL